MKHRNRVFPWPMCLLAALAFAAAPFAAAQSHPAAAPLAQAPSESDIANTQEQLLRLLRLSPVLTTVVAHDPSLLADQPYVERNNPELAQFLVQHPDIPKNPEFYLFSHLEQGRGGRRDQALERAVWPDLVPDERRPSQISDVMHQMIPIIIVPAIFLAIVWTIKIFVDGRRWNRTFKLQSEVHSKLIDRFTSSQDLAAYMQTEAGRRFLEASPMALGSDAGMRMPNVVARVLTPLTVGIIMVLSGIGLFLLQLHADADMVTPLLVLGTLALMPGIGFILSAGATWLVARRLGMLPEKEDLGGAPPAHINTIDRP
jgi:hypothetical protein